METNNQGSNGRIKQKEKIEAELKKIELEENKKNLIFIPELNIDIEKEIHHKNESYDNLVEEFGKDFIEEHLPTYAQLQFLRNSDKYRELLGLIDTWEFVKQEDKISKEKGFVSRFVANPVRAGLGSGRNPSIWDWGLGVRFVFARKSKGDKK